MNKRSLVITEWLIVSVILGIIVSFFIPETFAERLRVGTSTDLSGYLKLDQTIPQTIENGVPLMTTAVDEYGSCNQLVNKCYIDGGTWLIPPIIEWYDPVAEGGLPTDPTVGDRYGADSTGYGWTDGYIYEWDGDSWVEHEPEEGWMLWDLWEMILWAFYSGGWMEVGSDSYWDIEVDQTGLTGDKAGSFHLTTTGNVTTGNLTVNGTTTLTMNDSAGQNTITQLSTTGTEDTPFILIDDDRTGTTANEKEEAALVIDSEGEFGLYVLDGGVAISSYLHVYGNFIQIDDGIGFKIGTNTDCLLQWSLNGQGDDLLIYFFNTLSSVNSGAIFFSELSPSGMTTLDDYTSPCLVLANNNGADANDFSYVSMGEISENDVTIPHYFDFYTSTGSSDGSVNATTTEIGAIFRFGDTKTAATVATDPGDVVMNGQLEVQGNLTTTGNVTTGNLTVNGTVVSDTNLRTGWTLYNLTADDDLVIIPAFDFAATVTSVACVLNNTAATTNATVQLYNSTGGVMCSAFTCLPYTSTLAYNTTITNATLASGQNMYTNVTNTPDPVTDVYSFIIRYKRN